MIFVVSESTFVVKLTKSSRGLGLSVTGGIDSGGSWPGLIRIKRLFPHQPASACGLLNVGDLIIEANGITLTGLTNYVSMCSRNSGKFWHKQGIPQRN
jgi:C-terminal processing protease CtpA/Prc